MYTFLIELKRWSEFFSNCFISVNNEISDIICNTQWQRGRFQIGLDQILLVKKIYFGHKNQIPGAPSDARFLFAWLQLKQIYPTHPSPTPPAAEISTSTPWSTTSAHPQLQPRPRNPVPRPTPHPVFVFLAF